MTPLDQMGQGSNDVAFNALCPGHAVGRFMIESLDATGAYGATYRARDMRQGNEVMVREFLPPALAHRRADGGAQAEPGLAEDFARGRRHFLHGGRIIAALRAPCIVRVLACIEAGGTAYIVTECPSGIMLSDRLAAQAALTPDEIGRILWPLLDGLELVHSRGFFHGEICPENIFLDADGRPTLVDFGAAGSVMAASDASPYAALERIDTGYGIQVHTAPAKQGPWTDIYSLAAILHRALTGQTPPCAYDRLQQDHYRPLAKLRPEPFATSFLAGIDRGLGLHRRDRPQSIGQWRSILWPTAPVARRPKVEAAPEPASAPIPAPEPAPEPAPAAAAIREPAMMAVPRDLTPQVLPLPARAPRRRRPLLIGLAAGSVALLGALAYFLLPGSSPLPPASTTVAKSDGAEAARQQMAAEQARRQAETEAVARREEEARRKQAEADQAALRQRQAEEARLQAEAEAKRKADAAAAQNAQKAEPADPAVAEAAESSLALGTADRQQLQAALAARGFDPQGVDGVFGPRTRQAIAAWQKSHNEPATGFLSSAQKLALLAAAPAAATAPATAVQPPANPFDGLYAGTADLSTGSDRFSLQLVDGKGTGQWSVQGCGVARFTLSVSSDGNAALALRSFDLQCQPVDRRYDGHIDNDTLRFSFAGAGEPSGGVTLKRQSGQ